MIEIFKQDPRDLFNNLVLIALIAVVGLIFISPLLALLLALYWSFAGEFSAAAGALWYLVCFVALTAGVKAGVRYYWNN